MKTFVAKPHEIKHPWCLVDAKNQRLGRLAADIALRLRGKHNPLYTPHVDTGDYVVVINAASLVVSGKKAENKIYYRHSGYPGSLRAQTFLEMQTKHPGRTLELAVKGMLPKGPLGRAMLKKLKIFPGAHQSYAAQKPEPHEQLIFRK